MAPIWRTAIPSRPRTLHPKTKESLDVTDMDGLAGSAGLTNHELVLTPIPRWRWRDGVDGPRTRTGTWQLEVHVIDKQKCLSC